MIEIEMLPINLFNMKDNASLFNIENRSYKLIKGITLLIITLTHASIIIRYLRKRYKWLVDINIMVSIIIIIRIITIIMRSNIILEIYKVRN